MSEKYIIEIKKLGKVFLTEDVKTHALFNVDLSIRKGEFVALTGPSGSGKSTLLSIIGLLEDQTSGEYLFKGHDVKHIGSNERSHLRNRELGFIFQDFNLLDELTVLENVKLPLRYRGVKRSEMNSKALSVLQKLDILSRKDHYPAQLSGGQQQRVAICRAIVGEPSILLADEPTGNLDSKNGEAVMNTLKLLNQQGTTVCMVTHEEKYAERSTRNIKLFDGKILQ